MTAKKRHGVQPDALNSYRIYPMFQLRCSSKCSSLFFCGTSCNIVVAREEKKWEQPLICPHLEA